MKHSLWILAVVLGSIFLSSMVGAELLTCTFNNNIAHINCNLAGAKESFCYNAMGAIANNPATATTCTTGTIVCSLNRSGNQTVRCSNTPSYVSGPTSSGGSNPLGSTATPQCSYNDCELNQVACGSAYAYNLCVGPDASGCNRWESTLCVGNDRCMGNTTADFERCMGVGPGRNKPGSVEQVGGIFFFRDGSTTPPTTPSTGSGNTGSNGSGGTIPPTSGSATTTPGNQTPSSNSVYTTNGKMYYQVKSDDPNKNTGNKVCASQGKTCVGYTDYSTASCRYFHPNSKVENNSIHGSKSGYYCNGPPQREAACENTYDTCQVCPQCNVNVDCGTEIGSQFREMYVECAATTGSVALVDSTRLQRISIIGDGRYNVEDVSTGNVYGVVVQNGQIASWQEGALTAITATIRVKPQALAALQVAPNIMAEVRNQLSTGGIEYIPANVFESIRFLIFRVVINFQ